MLTLSVSHGTVTLDSTNGLTFTSGSNGSASLTVSGTVIDFNAAIINLTYTPTLNYAGSDTLVIQVSDPGDGLSASASVAITVSPLAPLITGPASASVSENGSLTFSSANGNPISITDPGPGASGSATLDIGADYGSFTLATTAGLTFRFGSNGMTAFGVSGSVSNMNAALDGLVFQPRPSYSGPDEINMVFGDLGDNFEADKHMAINVTALGTPTIIAPASASVVMNGTVTFSAANGDAISVADAAAGSNSDSMTLSATHGAITLASTVGLTFTTGNNGSASFTVSGPVSNLDNALSGMIYTPTANYAGPDSLSISVSDPSDGQSGSGSVAITVSPLAPSITAPLSARSLRTGRSSSPAATRSRPPTPIPAPSIRFRSQWWMASSRWDRPSG